MITRSKKIFLVLCIFFLCVSSQAKALTITPVRFEVTTDPGTEVGSDMLLINDQASSKTFYSSFSNFEAEGDTGTPKFTDSTTGLASWMEAPASVTLAPGETKKISFTIRVPAGTEAGGYFSTIFWSTNPPSGAGPGQVSIGAKVGMLVLLTVSGDVKEAAGLHDFKTVGGQWLYRALPVGFEYRFSNDGNDRVKPAGSIVIRSIFGWKAGSILANPSDGNVLPHSTRKFSPLWGRSDASPAAGGGYSFARELSREWHNFGFGLYRAKLTALYGKNSTAVASKNIYFLIVPVELLGIALLLFGGGFFILRKFLRTYKRSIERKVEARMRAQPRSEI